MPAAEPTPALAEARRPAVQARRRQSHGHLLQWTAAVGALVLFAGVYLVLMRLTLEISRVDAARTPEERDYLYLWLHSAVLFAATATGFGLGKWLNGLGVAYATLFFAVIASSMMFVHLGSYSLACDGGHNDIVRHWTC